MRRRRIILSEKQEDLIIDLYVHGDLSGNEVARRVHSEWSQDDVYKWALIICRKRGLQPPCRVRKPLSLDWAMIHDLREHKVPWREIADEVGYDMAKMKALYHHHRVNNPELLG